MQDIQEKDGWRERWTLGRTGWELGKAHPSLPQLITHARREGALPQGARVFSAGAGRAYSEAALAAEGFAVRAVDLSPEAVAIAKQLHAGTPGLDIAVADLFVIPPEEKAAFDAIYDRAMLCALGPDARAEYVAAITERLKPGGLFCGILFRKVVLDRPPPPYEVDEREADRLFSRDFQLCYAAAVAPPPEIPAIHEEWLVIWRKKG